jgi:hypothetical protein
VFAPDGGRILTASDDHTARLWDRDDRLITTLQGHTEEVASAEFAQDGDRILTASADRTARLWDRHGKPLTTLQGHTRTVYSALFAPDPLQGRHGQRRPFCEKTPSPPRSACTVCHCGSANDRPVAISGSTSAAAHAITFASLK